MLICLFVTKIIRENKQKNLEKKDNSFKYFYYFMKFY